jgi:hypothetical protein
LQCLTHQLVARKQEICWLSAMNTTFLCWTDMARVAAQSLMPTTCGRDGLMLRCCRSCAITMTKATWAWIVAPSPHLHPPFLISKCHHGRAEHQMCDVRDAARCLPDTRRALARRCEQPAAPVTLNPRGGDDLLQPVWFPAFSVEQHTASTYLSHCRATISG